MTKSKTSTTGVLVDKPKRMIGSLLPIPKRRKENTLRQRRCSSFKLSRSQHQWHCCFFMESSRPFGMQTRAFRSRMGLGRNEEKDGFTHPSLRSYQIGGYLDRRIGASPRYETRSQTVLDRDALRIQPGVDGAAFYCRRGRVRTQDSRLQDSV